MIGAIGVPPQSADEGAPQIPGLQSCIAPGMLEGPARTSASVFDLWIKDWRRRRIVRRSPPDTWQVTLEQSFWYWSELDATQRHRLLGMIAIFLHEKEIVVPASLGDAEAVRVTVAAAACLMLLGFDDLYCFDQVRTVILTLEPFRQTIQHGSLHGLATEVYASGVYSKGAPIVLSWPDVSRDCAFSHSRRNVVIHEFAHHIDDLDGTMAGDPPFTSAGLNQRWQRVARQSMQQLARELHSGLTPVLDPYGLTNPVEFFAVACEAYFCRPTQLSVEYVELFELLRTLFRIDSRSWFRDEESDEREQQSAW